MEDRTVNNSRTRAEYVRIAWRNLVMSLPGGVAWLCVQCRILKFKEDQIGPHRLRYPEE